MQTRKQSLSRMITMASKHSVPHSSALGLDAEITPLLTQPLPHDCFPDGTSNPDIIYQILSEELLLDGNSKQNLATFCQTWESPQVHKLMDLAIDKNLIALLKSLCRIFKNYPI